MRRAVERYLEDPLAEQVIRGNLTPQSPILVSVENDKLAFRQKELSPNTISS
jgi:ATP-dependent Clp protease ATP-binding subunit ClpC